MTKENTTKINPDYCDHCNWYKQPEQEHKWFCPTNANDTLVRNTAKKVDEILVILEEHFR